MKTDDEQGVERELVGFLSGLSTLPVHPSSLFSASLSWVLWVFFSPYITEQHAVQLGWSLGEREDEFRMPLEAVSLRGKNLFGREKFDGFSLASQTVVKEAKPT